MPHKNEHILVHFPSADEEQVITMSTIRGTSGGLSDTPSMSKPTEKCMETKWGKTMALHEESIDFHTPLIQALFLEDSIEIISNDRIEITSETELNIGKSEMESEEGGEIEETAQISIEAEEMLSFVVTSTRTGLELEENTDFYNIFKIDSEGTKKATYPTITSEGMQAGEAAAEQIAIEQATAEQAEAEQEAPEESEKGPLWKRIGKGALKAAAGIAIGVAVVVAAPVIAAASTAVAIAGCIIAAGSFLVGASLFCEGVNDIAFGVQGYDEEERPPTDGVLGLTGQRMELMEGCVTLAMLVLTGAELYYATAGILGYGTYLLNERLSKLPNIWPTSSYSITGFNSFGTATMGRVWDWTSVPAIPYTLAPAVPSIALLSNAQVVNMIEDGIAKMSGSGFGGSGGNVPPEGSRKLTEPSKTPNPETTPDGNKTKVNYNDKDPNNIKALEGENEAADILAQNGYDIEQNPKLLDTDKVSVTRNPDYRIEGELFDCYTPTVSEKSVRGIWSEVEAKVLKEQTQRVVVNLEKSQWSGDINKLIKQFKDWSIDKLEEVLIIDKSGKIFRIFP